MEGMCICASFHAELFALIRLALAGDARATFPGGEGNDNVFLDSFVEDWLKKGLENIRKI